MILRIGIVDDNNFLIENIRERLSFFEDTVLRMSASNGKEAVDHLLKNNALDIILMDIEMPVMNGIEATQHIKKSFPQIKVIMLTAFDDDELIFKAIQAGADGYLLKEANPEQLHDYLLMCKNGGAAMTPSIAMKTLKFLRNPLLMESIEEKESIRLTKREIEVLEQISTGLGYIQIAENLFISPGTVRKHLENIYKKLQVHSKIEAVYKARRHNLI